MLAHLKEVLEIAEEKKIAIGAFNTPNIESLCAVIEAAENLRLPVIIQMAECHEDLMPLSQIGPLMVMMAKNASIPVCVHLDHGETLGYIRRSLEYGFTSVMFDGSRLPYEKNVEETQKAVALAEQFGADVEAELGYMGEREFGSGVSLGDGSKIYTNPVQAKDFVARTGIDALACSFGTTHGIYLNEPKINFDIVRQVRELTENIPVVMHGGSGVSAEDFHTAINAGVRKINYFTYMDKAGGTACRNYLEQMSENDPAFYSLLRLEAVKAMKNNVVEAMKVFAGCV